ncbi:MAG TPA: molybdopterin dinucleotide binding domain-containing protein [Gemmatimonadaceae bacterium]|nr:molybdopterin dinucleotide binding domain-containing protein [Gemmatimonadaceae bacterium]
MKRIRLPETKLNIGSRFRPQLNVIEYTSTRRGDPDRGPVVRMRSSEARFRLIQDGELVWVAGPRRQELAILVIDESIPEGHVALRDIAGVTITEFVTVSKPDMDTPVGGRHFG